MKKKKFSRQLFLYMNNVYMGELIRKTSRNIEFTYDKSWLKREDTSVLSAYPSMNKREWDAQKITMAMALHGKKPTL